MADMLRSGAQWLADRLKASASRAVTYRRGSDTCPLSATVGKKLLKISDQNGDAQIVTADRDYLFTAADLIINGTLTLPVKGDVIVDDNDGAGMVLFEVLAPGNEPEYQTDAQQILTRVHTKNMGTE